MMYIHTNLIQTFSIAIKNVYVLSKNSLEVNGNDDKSTAPRQRPADVLFLELVVEFLAI